MLVSKRNAPSDQPSADVTGWRYWLALRAGFTYWRYCLAVRPLRIAVIGGAQYDQVNTAFESFSAEHGTEVQVAFRGDHVALNAHLAAALPAGAAYDLVSTHSKYVPSQARWLWSLDELIDAAELSVLQPAALDLCRVFGALKCVPRNIDARLLFVNRNLIPDGWVPASWQHLHESLGHSAAASGSAGYAFPVRDSGLFGTFYELTAAFGAHLFDEGGRADFTSSAAITALEWLMDVSTAPGLTPSRMVADAWYFDDVSAAFRAGEVAVVGDWPGYYGLLAAQKGLRDRVRVMRYPVGVDGRRHVYAGCHAWAIPLDAPDVQRSLLLLQHLTAAGAAMADAAAGMVPVRADVSMPVEHPLDAERSELLRLTVASDLLTFPPMEDYPAIEEAAAVMLGFALSGRLTARAALENIRV